MANYKLRQTGQEVQDLLDKIEQSKIEDGTVTIGDESLTPVSSEELQQGLAGKQDVISDLSAIREGATLGATAYQKPSDGIAKEDLVASVQASLEKADSALQSYTETDPTVPAWAKASTKPTYTAAEVGALPDTTEIPDALADLSDDATHRLVADTEKAAWNAKYTKPSGGIPETDLASGVTEKLNAEEIFIATYGTTTQSQVQAAASAGKVIICFYGNKMYVYAGESAAGHSQFTSVLYDKAYRVYLKNSSWGSASYDLPIDAVLYTTQNLSDSQKSVARGNIGAGTYSKPDNGIPGSDIAAGVIPDVSQFVTATVNNLVNYYLKSETYTRDEIQALIAAIPGMLFVPVNTLPTASAETVNKIYIVPATNPQTQNQMDEFYTKVDGSSYTWEYFGSASIDLSNYVTTTALNTALANYWPKADVVNITLSDLAVSGDWDDIENNPIPEPSASDNGKVLGVTDAQGTLGWVQGGGGGATEIFIAEYDVTPLSDIYAAYQAGKYVVVYYDGEFCTPVHIYDNSAEFFLPNDDGYCYFYIVTSNGWEVELEYRIPTDDMLAYWNDKYDKPSGGIPKTDLASAVQTSLGKADTALQSFTETDPIFTASPAHGITSSDITNWNGKQNAIADLADIRSGAAAGATAYQKPSTGIPAADIASGVIPTIESLTTAEIDTIWNNAA